MWKEGWKRGIRISDKKESRGGIVKKGRRSEGRGSKVSDKKG